jgi:hypothetical protein
LPYLILAGFFLTIGLMVALTTYPLLRLSRWVQRRIATNKRAGVFETPSFQARLRKLVYVQLCIYAALGVAAIVTIVRHGTIMSPTGLWILAGFILSGFIAAIVILSMMENDAGGKS